MELNLLGPGFAAEVRGVGLADVAERDDAYADVRAAFEAHSVLVFRGQPVTDELQVAYSRRFGPLEIAKAASRGEGTPFSILTNIEPDGNLVPPDHKEALRARANQLWHTDSCFKDPPALASVLSARTISPVGGETEFASMRLGWERLPDAMRARLADAYAWHDYAHSRGKIASHLASEREKVTLPPVRWRIRWRNPVNGRDSLYVASHTCGIDGMAKEEAQRLIAELIAHTTAPGHTYLHRWQPGDVIMWDNRCVLHRGRPWPDDKPRHVVRTTISATDADGLAEMRGKRNQTGTTQSPQPRGVKAGDGRHVFDLAGLDRVEAGPGYSTAAGALVEGERMMVGLMRMPRGTGALPHRHPNEQWVYVLEGTLKVDIEGGKWDAKAGSLVFIPANAVHALVASTERDAVFLTAKDTSHGIAGTAVGDASAGAHYEPGFAPAKRKS